MASNPTTTISIGNANTKPKDKPKPKPQTKNSQNPGNTLSGILSSLECPTCNELFQAPIFICTLGHNICGSCKNQIANNHCLICNNSISGQRNFTLEEIVQKCATKCCNMEYGCKYASSDEKIRQHQRKCLYKPAKCPIGEVHNQCQWKGVFSDLVKHFENIHPKNMIVKSGIEIKFQDFNVGLYDHDLQLVTYGKSGLFLYHVEIDPKNNVANWAVQKIGPDSLGVAFDYEFALAYKNKSMKIVEECMPSASVLKSIFQTGNCVSIPLNVLKNYITDTKELSFRIHIRQRGELNTGNFNKPVKKVGK